MLYKFIVQNAIVSTLKTHGETSYCLDITIRGYYHVPTIGALDEGALTFETYDLEEFVKLCQTYQIGSAFIMEITPHKQDLIKQDLVNG